MKRCAKTLVQWKDNATFAGNKSLGIMKIIATSDWHIGNLFHGIDRLSEHQHFLNWLKGLISERVPDALLVAGDIFDNGNPSAAAQELYYGFLDDITHDNPQLQVIITAGNHDSANRLEAPAALLHRHKIEVRGRIHREWVKEGAPSDDNTADGHWAFKTDDLMIPITSRDGKEQGVVLAVPFLRSDVSLEGSYSKGVTTLLRQLTDEARDAYPHRPLIMMAHMYAAGAEIREGSSEKILIGGQDQVTLGKWDGHPDYLTCGHIHKRQHIWNTDWARYSGSVLPMSFAERDYHHGVDLITIPEDGKPSVTFMEYTPQHPLMTLPDGQDALDLKEMRKAIKLLPERTDGTLDEHSIYLELRLRSEKIKADDRKKIEGLLENKDVVLCKLTQVLPDIDVATSTTSEAFHSIDDILRRNPAEAVEECFVAKHGRDLSEEQRGLLERAISEAHENMGGES